MEAGVVKRAIFSTHRKRWGLWLSGTDTSRPKRLPAGAGVDCSGRITVLMRPLPISLGYSAAWRTVIDMATLYRYLNDYWRLVLAALLLAAVNQIFSLLDPLIFRHIIDSYATRFHDYTSGAF